MQREPETVEALFNKLALSRGANAHLDAAVSQLQRDLADQQNIEVRARRLVERLALALQGALLVRHSPPAIADAFCATRLGGDWGAAFGTLPAGVDVTAIIQRARPQLG